MPYSMYSFCNFIESVKVCILQLLVFRKNFHLILSSVYSIKKFDNFCTIYHCNSLFVEYLQLLQFANFITIVIQKFSIMIYNIIVKCRAIGVLVAQMYLIKMRACVYVCVCVRACVCVCVCVCDLARKLASYPYHQDSADFNFSSLP